MIHFFLVLVCTSPHSTTAIEFKSWNLCHAAEVIAHENDDAHQGCVSQCVGKGVFEQIWSKKGIWK